MLEYVKFNFAIQLTSKAHIGDGREKSLEDFLKDRKSYNQIKDDTSSSDDSVKGSVSTVARANNGQPVLEVTAFRGALRNHLVRCKRSDLATYLLGPGDIATEGGEPGMLWLFGGVAEKLERKNEKLVADLPYWNDDAQSYVLAGIMLDQHTMTAEDAKLYNTEYLPENTVFVYEAIFHGDVEAFTKNVVPALEILRIESGLKVGGQKGYGYGFAELQSGNISYQHCYYDVGKHEFITDAPTTSKKIAIAKFGRRHVVDELSFFCQGPFLVLDPQRKVNQRDPDWQALSDLGEPYIPPKAIMQALRNIAAKVEIEQHLHSHGYENIPYDDPDAHFRVGDNMGSMTITQRLFGVPGWAKIVSFGNVNLEKDFNEPSGEYSGQMIKLDVFTQAPIDGALVSVKAPFGYSLTFDILFDEDRYPDDETAGINKSFALTADKKFLIEVIEQLKRREQVLKLGHAQAAGFGWFTYVDSD